MEQSTLENLTKLGVILGTAFVGYLGTLSITNFYSNFRSRSDEVNRCMESYEIKVLKKRPNLFNIRRILDPKNRERYWSRFGLF